MTIGNCNCAEIVVPVLPIGPHAWFANIRLQCPTVAVSPFAKSAGKPAGGDKWRPCDIMFNNVA